MQFVAVWIGKPGTDTRYDDNDPDSVTRFGWGRNGGGRHEVELPGPQEQRQKDSVHELQGCLHTLETVLLGPDLAPEKRGEVGLRLTIHTPDGKGNLKQVMDYVGDQRTVGGAGRTMPENAGVAGQAYRQARLHPTQPELLHGSRTSGDYDAFVQQMVSSYAFTLEGAKNLNPATMSWLALAITNNGEVQGVLYCDAKKADFFTEPRREDISHAMAGIAYFVGLRYS